METQKSTINPIKRFWLLLKPDRQEIRNVYVYAIFNGLVNLSLPLGIQSIINLIQGGQLNTSWVVLVSFVILGVIINGILQINQMRITENLQQKIFVRGAFDFAYRVPRIKLEALIKHYAPELMNRFFDILSVQKGLSKIIIDFTTTVVQVLFGLLLLSFYHPFFIAFSLILIALIYAIFKFTAAAGLRTSLKESKYKYKIVHWLQELARTNTTFKLAGSTELPLTIMDKLSSSYISSREGHFRILLRQYWLLIGFKVLVVGGLLIIGSLLVMDGKMNIGQFVASEIVILLILTSAEKLIFSLDTIYDVLTSLEKISVVTDLPLEREDGLEFKLSNESAAVSLQFKDLSLCYDYPKEVVFKNVNLKINAGDRILIVGANGEGKSTVLQLISGITNPTEGSVLYDDVPKQNLMLESIRTVIGDCFKKEQIFSGTLKDNISLGRPSVQFENIKWAVQKMGLEEFVQKLPEGYDTIIGAAGVKLSESIRTRILLARSIAVRPGLLLIQDVFGVFSDQEKHELLSFIVDSSNNWTVVFTSNNLGIAPYVNAVYQLKDKNINEVTSNNLS